MFCIFAFSIFVPTTKQLTTKIMTDYAQRIFDRLRAEQDIFGYPLHGCIELHHSLRTGLWELSINREGYFGVIDAEISNDELEILIHSVNGWKIDSDNTTLENPPNGYEYDEGYLVNIGHLHVESFLDEIAEWVA